MQLDQSRIAIRQRGWLENMDLALHVIRQHAGPLVLATFVGCLPFALLNGWLLRRGIDAEVDPRQVTSFIWFYLWWMVAELPLATSLITLYLGQALFSERPTAKQVAQDFARSLPQLLLLQVLVRGLLVLPVITWLLLFVVWPYLNEIILLERNPLRSGRRGQISTTKRSSALHSATSGELLLQALGSMMLGGLMVVAIWRGLGFLLGTFVGSWGLSQSQYTVLLPIAAWTVASFFAVVRFLSYLDLRIRREGWEVELNLRGTRPDDEATGMRKALLELAVLAAIGLLLQPSTASAQEDVDEAVKNGRSALRDSYNRPWYDGEQDSIRRIDVRASKPRESSPGGDAPNLDFLSVLAWVVLGALLLLVAYLLVMAYLRRENFVAENQTKASKRDYDVADRIEALPFMARRDQSDLLGQARKHYEAGNYAEAIIYLFSYQLVELDRHGIVHLDRGKTNRQYLREARVGGLRGLLEKTMVTFEDVFFGSHPLDRGRFEQCWNRLDEFQSMLGATV